MKFVFLCWLFMLVVLLLGVVFVLGYEYGVRILGVDYWCVGKW